MAWLTAFKLGKAGSEKTFDNNPSEVTFDDVPIENTERNLAGNLKKSFVKMGCRIALKYPNCTTDEMNKLYSIKNAYSYFKRLLVNDAFAITDEERTSLDKSTVLLVPSSRAGITIDGVWLATDPTHAGTNYYTGGSFGEEDKAVTLGTLLPYDNIDVLVSYKYQGWDVNFVNMNVFNSYEKPFTHDLTMEFEGI